MLRCCPNSLVLDLDIHDISDLVFGIHHLGIDKADLPYRILHLLYYGLLLEHMILTGLRVHRHLYILGCTEMVLAGGHQ